MPPIQPDTRHADTNYHPQRALRLLVCAGLVFLAGCAAQQTRTADASSSHLLRDKTLLSAQSDPLGAWLAYSQDSDISFPQSHAGKPSDTMVSTAMQFLGVKYRSGGEDPGQGFDCSGLVAYAAEKSLGLKLPRTARDQAREGISVDRKDLRRGDLVFFNTLGRKFSHVGIYLGNQKFVHAPRTGARIRVESMDISYWNKRYNGARRLQVSSTTASR